MLPAHWQARMHFSLPSSSSVQQSAWASGLEHCSFSLMQEKAAACRHCQCCVPKLHVLKQGKGRRHMGVNCCLFILQHVSGVLLRRAATAGKTQTIIKDTNAHHQACKTGPVRITNCLTYPQHCQSLPLSKKLGRKVLPAEYSQTGIQTLDAGDRSRNKLPTPICKQPRRICQPASLPLLASGKR